jgi:hypothetical protein
VSELLLARATARQQKNSETDLMPVFAVADIGLDADNQSRFLITFGSGSCGTSKRRQQHRPSANAIREI